MTTTLTQDEERYPESPHVQAKHWAELVRGRNRIRDLEAERDAILATGGPILDARESQAEAWDEGRDVSGQLVFKNGVQEIIWRRGVTNPYRSTNPTGSTK